MKWLVTLVITNLFLASYGLVLKTKKGVISGIQETSRKGRTYYAFRHVPYAKPPVGNLRFKNPQPHDGWTGMVNGAEDSPMCLQNYIFAPSVRNWTLGQEDCLYLNIYTPFLKSEKKFPVMIYIHGGAFICGIADPRDGPKLLMDEDVILVTVSYRLGALGFLSTEDDILPGNFGMKDQAMAIKWLSENINDYDGDPGSMIVYGDATGGACVQYLIKSPMTRDLLKGGISQSGVLDSIWGFSSPGKAKALSDKFINDLGCDSRPLLECLQTVDKENILQSQRKVLEFDLTPEAIYAPVVEKENEGAFLTEDPRTIQSSLPWITGYSIGEGSLKIVASVINQDITIFDDYRKNIDKMLPILLDVKPGTPGLDQLMSLIKKTFFFNLNDIVVLLDQVERFHYELYFVVPLTKSLKSHPGPKYAYVYNSRPADRFSPTKRSSNNTKGSLDNINVSDLLMKLWTNFAKSRNPTSERVSFIWEQYSNNNYLHINSKGAKMENNSFDNITEFWTEAYSLVQPKTKNDEL